MQTWCSCGQHDTLIVDGITLLQKSCKWSELCLLVLILTSWQTDVADMGMFWSDILHYLFYFYSELAPRFSPSFCKHAAAVFLCRQGAFKWAFICARRGRGRDGQKRHNNRPDSQSQPPQQPNILWTRNNPLFANAMPVFLVRSPQLNQASRPTTFTSLRQQQESDHNCRDCHLKFSPLKTWFGFLKKDDVCLCSLLIWPFYSNLFVQAPLTEG